MVVAVLMVMIYCLHNIGRCPREFAIFLNARPRVIRQSYTQRDVETAPNFPRIKRDGRGGGGPALMERG